MDASRMFQLSLKVTTGADDAVPQEALAELRAELADAGATRVEQAPADPAPAGARGVELLGALQLLVTVVSTIDAAMKIVRTVRRWAIRVAERHERRPRVTVAGAEVDLTTATDLELERIAQSLVKGSFPVLPGVRKALIVANASYDDPALAQLRAPTHDADTLGQVLGDPAIGGFNVDLLKDADERTIRRHVAELFIDRDRDDLLLLHFSCHGVKDTRGQLHLAARDTSLALLSATSIPAHFINDQLSQTRSRRVVLILDCCYSGAFARGSTVRSGGEVPNEFAGSGRVVLTASSATEYAFEDGELTRSEGRPSIFTDALVRGLRTGEADLDADGEVSIDDLYDYTYRAVRDRTPGQSPTKWSFGVEGRLIIARSPRPAALPAEILDDLASDRVALRLEAVTSLMQLLRGERAGLAAAARAKLTELRDSDDSRQVRRGAERALVGVVLDPSPPSVPPKTLPPIPPPIPPLVPPPVPPSSGLSMLSMIFGILGIPLSCLLIGVPLAVAAVVIGVIAVRKVSAGRASNRGQAIAGISCGAVGVVGFLVVLLIGLLADTDTT